MSSLFTSMSGQPSSAFILSEVISDSSLLKATVSNRESRHDKNKQLKRAHIVDLLKKKGFRFYKTLLNLQLLIGWVQFCFLQGEPCQGLICILKWKMKLVLKGCCKCRIMYASCKGARPLKPQQLANQSSCSDKGGRLDMNGTDPLTNTCKNHCFSEMFPVLSLIFTILQTLQGLGKN